MTDYIEEDEDNRDEYSTRDQPIAKPFYEKYGYDERNGPPEQENDKEDEKPWGNWDRRSW